MKASLKSTEKDVIRMLKNKLTWLIPLIAAMLLFGAACGGSGSDVNPDNPNANTSDPGSSPADSDVISILTPSPDDHRAELDAILKRVTMLEGVKTAQPFSRATSRILIRPFIWMSQAIKGLRSATAESRAARL